MLLMADRGFFSYTAFTDSAATGAALLWRMRAGNILPGLEELPDGSYLSAVYSSPNARRNITDPVAVRVIEYTVTPVNRRVFPVDHHRPRPEQASAGDVADLYGNRVLFR